MSNELINSGLYQRIKSFINNKYCPIIFIFLFFFIFFYPYLLNHKVVVPFQLLSGNPSIIQEQWLKSAPKNQNGIGFDLLAQFYPWKGYIQKSFSEKFLPLWNSFNLSGTPFIANIQVGYFYPTNIFLIFFTTPVAITLMAILNLLIASFGIYFYLRTLNVERIWSCIGAIGFVQSAYLIDWFQWFPHTGAMAWFPWILSFTHLAIKQGNIKWFLYANISVAFAVLSGHIQFAFYGLLAVIFYLLIMVLFGFSDMSLNFSKRLIRLVVLGSSLALGAGLLTLCQLLPSWELTRHCLRGAENINNLRASTFNLIQFLQIFSRDFFLDFTPINGHGRFVIGLDNLFVPLFLSGVLLPAFFSKNIYKRNFFPLLGIFILALGIIFGEKHIFDFMSKIPLFDHFRAPTRFGYIGSFTIACIAALFLSDLNKKLQLNNKNNIFVSSPYILTAFIFLGMVIVFWWMYRAQAYNKSFLIQIIFILSFLVIYQISLYLTRFRQVLIFWPIMIIIIGTIESYISNSDFNPRMTMPRTGIIKFIPELQKVGDNDGLSGRLLRVSQNTFDPLFVPANLMLLQNISDIHGYNTFIRKEYIDFFEDIDSESLRSVAKGMNQIRNFEPEELNSASFRLLGIRYIVSDVALSKEYPIIGKIGSASLYKMENTLPRLFLLPSWEITDHYMNHHDVLNKAKQCMKDYKIKIQKNPNGYEAEIFADHNAQVVVGELYYPGWRVWIDDKESVVHTLAGGLMATQIGNGKHHVRFEYRPKNFFIALSISIVSWIVMIISLILCHISERRD